MLMISAISRIVGFSGFKPRIIGIVLALVCSLAAAPSNAATFSVANGDVAGLKSALATANGNGVSDIINLATNGSYTLTTVDNTSTVGANGLPVIAADGMLTINGNGSTIARTNAPDTPEFRIFQTDGAIVAISKLTMTNGSGGTDVFGGTGGGGGGIYNGGTLTLSNCTLSGNTATLGGAIYEEAGTLTATNCAFTGNVVFVGAGAIYSESSLSLTNCTFDDNLATGIFSPGLAGAIFNGGPASLSHCSFHRNGSGAGGAIYHASNTLTLADCILAGNSAGYGGGIYNDGDADAANPGSATATLTNCTLSGNTATGDTSFGGGVGGGIYNAGRADGTRSGTATLTLANCTLSGNSAVGPTGRKGGAIFNEGDGKNVAGQSSASLTLSNCTLSGNFAGDGSNGFGGGIYNNGINAGIANLTVQSCTFSVNQAVSGGGALYNDVTNSTNTSTILVLGNTIFHGGTNTTIGSNGGFFITQGYNLSDDGGGGKLVSSTDQTGTNPQLDPAGLQNNGGPTQTIKLQANSPALDKGQDVSGAGQDQRGFIRPQDDPAIAPATNGDNSDIGAVEMDRPQSGPGWIVTTNDDLNDGSCGIAHCSLREAIKAADDNFAGNNTITFNIPGPGPHTIVLGSVLPSFVANTNLVGPTNESVTVSGNNAVPVFFMNARTVTISNLTIVNGKGLNGAPGFFGDPEDPSANGIGGTGFGGGVHMNGGTLTLRNCTLSNNTGGQGGQGAAGIGPGATTGNGGVAGGGGVQVNFGSLTVQNCTLNNNIGGAGGMGGDSTGCSGGSCAGGVGGRGGGGGLQISGGSLLLRGVTIASNTGGTGGAGGEGGIASGAGGPGGAGGLQVISSLPSVGNTAIAKNSGGGGGLSPGGQAAASGVPDVQGGVGSAGYNLVGKNNGSSGFTAAGDQTGTAAAPLDPKLGPLQNNGGPTGTMALLTGSPALDKGKAFGLTTDQRGSPRPVDNTAIANASGGDGSDIGAYEFPLPTISGRILDGQGAPIAGVNVSRGGGVSVLTASDGNYIFINVPNGSYTLTPTKSGYMFVPATRNVTVNGANIGAQNFTGYNATLGGRVAFSNGTGIANCEVRLNTGRSALTNGAGYFNFTGVLNGAYTVTPVLAGYSFDPAYRQVSINNASVGGVNFVGGYTVSGRIATPTGAAIVNQAVTRTGSGVPVYTNSAGYYFFYGVVNGAYTVTPTPGTLGFTPPNRSVTVNGASVSGQNFTGATGYTVSGRITTSSGVAIVGVTVTRTGGATATTNSAGYFTFTGVINGTYTLTPTKAGVTFTPATKNVTVNGANLAGQNFVGTG